MNHVVDPRDAGFTRTHTEGTTFHTGAQTDTGTQREREHCVCVCVCTLHATFVSEKVCAYLVVYEGGKPAPVPWRACCHNTPHSNQSRSPVCSASAFGPGSGYCRDTRRARGARHSPSVHSRALAGCGHFGTALERLACLGFLKIINTTITTHMNTCQKHVSLIKQKCSHYICRVQKTGVTRHVCVLVYMYIMFRL